MQIHQPRVSTFHSDFCLLLRLALCGSLFRETFQVAHSTRVGRVESIHQLCVCGWKISLRRSVGWTIYKREERILKCSKLMFGSSNVIGTWEDFHIHKIPKNGFDKSPFSYLPAFPLSLHLHPHDEDDDRFLS